MKPTIAFLTALISCAAFAGGWERYTAKYEVPVPPHLRNLAMFNVEGARARESASGTELRYKLPLELTGREIEIRLHGSLDANGNGELSSENAKGICKASSCALTYKQLNINEDQVRSVLVSRGFSGVDLEQRLEVAAAFRSGDPAGILHLNSYP